MCTCSLVCLQDNPGTCSRGEPIKCGVLGLLVHAHPNKLTMRKLSGIYFFACKEARNSVLYNLYEMHRSVSFR